MSKVSEDFIREVAVKTIMHSVGFGLVLFDQYPIQQIKGLYQTDTNTEYWIKALVEEETGLQGLKD